jgi:hypothetical protein
MTGFLLLRAAELVGGDADAFDWSLLVPIDVEGAIELPVRSNYSDATTVRSAPRMLPATQRLASLPEMPAESRRIRSWVPHVSISE